MPDATCAAFWKPFFRLLVRERSGACCRAVTVNGIAVYRRFDRWSNQGVFEKLFEHFSSDRDARIFAYRFDYRARSRLFVRRAKKHGQQSLGRSRGGHSTKIHLACDALGNAIRFILTGGERNDITKAESLIENLSADYVLADKGYDSEALVLKLEELGSEAVIPSRVNRKTQRVIDRHLYKERHLIECYIGKLKHFRRVFSRFDKLAKNYLSFVQFASTIIWLR